MEKRPQKCDDDRGVMRGVKAPKSDKEEAKGENYGGTVGGENEL